MSTATPHARELAARERPTAPSTPSTTPSRMPPEPTARQRELDARHRYGAAIAAAVEFLRRVQDRFEESSSAIDVHIQRARALSPAPSRLPA